MIKYYLHVLYYRKETVIIHEETEKPSKTTIDVGKEAAIEAEVKAARERAVIPLEIRMKQFRDMLAEKQVHTTEFIVALTGICCE